RPHHRCRVEHVIIEREVVARDVVDAGPVLSGPGRCAQTRGIRPKRVGVDPAVPIGLQGLLQLATRTDTGKAERAGDDGHGANLLQSSATRTAITNVDGVRLAGRWTQAGWRVGLEGAARLRPR